MTDLIEKIAEAMRTEFRELYGKEWSGPIKPPSFTTSDLVLASAALSVIKENAGDLVKPLVWEDRGDCSDAIACNDCYALRMSHVLNGWVFSINGQRPNNSATYDPYDTRESAKAAAQQHHTARVLSLLNLEVE